MILDTNAVSALLSGHPALARLLEPSELAPDAIATGVLGLLEDDARRRGMRARLEACAFRNGLPAAVTQVERLL